MPETLRARDIEKGMELQIGEAIGIVCKRSKTKNRTRKVVLQSGDTKLTYFLEPDEPVYVLDVDEEPPETKEFWEHIAKVRRTWQDR